MARKKSYSKQLTIIAILLLVLGFAQLIGLLTPVKSTFLQLTEPVYRPFYRLGNSIQESTTKPTDIKALQTENERLRDENLQLKLDLSSAEEAKRENQTLRSLLDYFDTQGDDLPRIISEVIARDPENPSILILTVGEREGVKVGNAVIVEDGVIVAKVNEVFTRTSKALLLSESKSQIAVTISNGPPTNKIARGDRGLSIILDQIPQQEIVYPGQLVITSGLEPTIPAGLIVGEIEEKISENNDLFQTAILRPLIDYSGVRTVAIVLTPDI